MASFSHLDANKIAADLNDYIAEHNAKPGSQNDSLEHFKSLSIPDMLSDLEATHHVVERKLWAEIDTDLNKILLVHYAHHGVMLTKLHHLFGLLRTDLEEHFAREEKLVFPLMRTYPRPNLEILTLVQNLEADHSAAGDIIKEIEALTDHFTVPADACATFKRTYQLLEEFVNDVFVHIFKENSIVFPEYAEKSPQPGIPGPSGGSVPGKTKPAGTAIPVGIVKALKGKRKRAPFSMNAAIAVPSTAMTAAKPVAPAAALLSVTPIPSNIPEAAGIRIRTKGQG